MSAFGGKADIVISGPLRLQAVVDCDSRHPRYGGGSDQHQKRLERGFDGFCHDDPPTDRAREILFLIRHALGCGILRSNLQSFSLPRSEARTACSARNAPVSFDRFCVLAQGRVMATRQNVTAAPVDVP